MENILEVSHKDIWAFEFTVYVALEFTLFLPICEVMPHFERILLQSGMAIDDYLTGENRFFLGVC